MINNCTITAIATPTGLSAGAETYSTETLSPAIRCQAAQPTRRQRYEFGALIADATLVLRIREHDLGSRDLVEKSRMTLAIDGRPSRTAGVLKVTEPSKPNLRAWTVFLSEGN